MAAKKYGLNHGRLSINSATGYVMQLSPGNKILSRQMGRLGTVSCTVELSFTSVEAKNSIQV